MVFSLGKITLHLGKAGGARGQTCDISEALVVTQTAASGRWEQGAAGGGEAWSASAHVSTERLCAAQMRGEGGNKGPRVLA